MITCPPLPVVSLPPPACRHLLPFFLSFSWALILVAICSAQMRNLDLIVLELMSWNHNAGCLELRAHDFSLWCRARLRWHDSCLGGLAACNGWMCRILNGSGGFSLSARVILMNHSLTQQRRRSHFVAYEWQWVGLERIRWGFFIHWFLGPLAMLVVHHIQLKNHPWRSFSFC
jgi:hypothetical protein